MSGTINQSFDKIGRRALRLIGAFAAGETPDAQSMTDVLDALNAMTKEWQADGIHIWTETEGFLSMTPGQIQYILGTGTTSQFGTGLVRTTSTADMPVGTMALALSSLAGVAVGNALGFGLPTGIVGATVTAINAATLTVTVNATLGLDVPAGTTVICYSPNTNGFRPLRILAMRRSNLVSGIDLPITQLARLDYQALPNKTQFGTVNSWFYDAQLPAGVLNLWQAPQAPITDILTFTFMRELDAWSSTTTVGDFPEEWVATLAYNLAVEISPEYDVSDARMARIIAIAADKKQTVQGFDKEPESICFGVSYEPGYR